MRALDKKDEKSDNHAEERLDKYDLFIRVSSFKTRGVTKRKNWKNSRLSAKSWLILFLVKGDSKSD